MSVKNQIFIVCNYRCVCVTVIFSDGMSTWLEYHLRKRSLLRYLYLHPAYKKHNQSNTHKETVNQCLNLQNTIKEIHINNCYLNAFSQLQPIIKNANTFDCWIQIYAPLRTCHYCISLTPIFFSSFSESCVFPRLPMPFSLPL